MTRMPGWQEPVTLLQGAFPKTDPLGVTFRSRRPIELPLPPALVAVGESRPGDGAGEDYSLHEEATLYWDDAQPVVMNILPGDHLRVREDIWVPVGELVKYPLGVYLRIRREAPLER